MRLLSSVICALIAAAAADVNGQSLAIPAAQRAEVDRLAAALHPKVVETRRDIHRHPELGYRETRTATLVADRLRALGFDEVRTGVGKTGVVGILKGGRPGKVVAVRADMDALPIPELIDVPYKSTVEGVKHACGHDAHVAVALGVAEVLSRMRAQLPGTVLMLFQPAEEGDPDGGKTGAIRMLEDGLFANPKPAAIFGLHVMPTIDAGTIGLNIGPAMASADRFTLTVVGRKTHGAYPHTGIDPVPIAAQIVMALQTIPSRQIDAQQATVVSVGEIKGGNRYNIIADKVELTGTVRTLSQEGPATVKAKMEAIAKGITSAYGATYTLNYVEGTRVTFNEPALARQTRGVLAAVAGEGKVIEPAPQMGAEDFSYYQREMPGVFFFLGVRNTAKQITAMVHTEYFDIDEDVLQLGVRAMSTTVLDYLQRD
jgi:amidohydrolase